MWDFIICQFPDWKQACSDPRPAAVGLVQTSGIFLGAFSIRRPNEQTVFVTQQCPDSHKFNCFETFQGDKVNMALLS